MVAGFLKVGYTTIVPTTNLYELNQLRRMMTERVFIISRKKTFLASHNLDGRPIHLHKFDVTIEFFGTKLQFKDDYNKSMLINYLVIDEIWQKNIIPILIDKETNKINVQNSSCEIIAEWIFDAFLNQRELFNNCNLKSIGIFDGDVSASVQHGEK